MNFVLKVEMSEVEKSVLALPLSAVQRLLIQSQPQTSSNTVELISNRA